VLTLHSCKANAFWTVKAERQKLCGVIPVLGRDAFRPGSGGVPQATEQGQEKLRWGSLSFIRQIPKSHFPCLPFCAMNSGWILDKMRKTVKGDKIKVSYYLGKKIAQIVRYTLFQDSLKTSIIGNVCYYAFKTMCSF